MAWRGEMDKKVLMDANEPNYLKVYFLIVEGLWRSG